MRLLDGLEKVINEHGSAMILKERIALANDKYAALEAKNEALQSENDTLRNDNITLKAKVQNLEEQLAQAQANTLTLKYGVYWDKSGNPFCPKCKTPISEVKWATYVNRQVHGLKCPCTERPFVLMEKGEPIHAQEAMKRMANPSFAG